MQECSIFDIKWRCVVFHIWNEDVAKHERSMIRADSQVLIGHTHPVTHTHTHTCAKGCHRWCESCNWTEVLGANEARSRTCHTAGILLTAHLNPRRSLGLKGKSLRSKLMGKNKALQGRFLVKIAKPPPRILSGPGKASGVRYFRQKR